MLSSLSTTDLTSAQISWRIFVTCFLDGTQYCGSSITIIIRKPFPSTIAIGRKSRTTNSAIARVIACALLLPLGRACALLLPLGRACALLPPLGRACALLLLLGRACALLLPLGRACALLLPLGRSFTDTDENSSSFACANFGFPELQLSLTISASSFGWWNYCSPLLFQIAHLDGGTTALPYYFR